MSKYFIGFIVSLNVSVKTIEKYDLAKTITYFK